MPRPVKSVPNAWAPYMDGQIWEFTQEEIRGMPNWEPMINCVDRSIFGYSKVQWYVNGKYYVRFYTPEDVVTMGKDYLEKLAGW